MDPSFNLDLKQPKSTFVICPPQQNRNASFLEFGKRNFLHEILMKQHAYYYSNDNLTQVWFGLVNVSGTRETHLFWSWEDTMNNKIKINDDRRDVVLTTKDLEALKLTKTERQTYTKLLRIYTNPNFTGSFILDKRRHRYRQIWYL